jgi:hypothetical protein
MFSIYFFSFPFGFYYLAFFCMSSFVQHSMLYFYNRFELPALEAGTVHLRPSIIFQSFVTTPTPTPSQTTATGRGTGGEPGRQVMTHTLPEHHSQGVEVREVERGDRTEAGNRGASGEEREGEEDGEGEEEEGEGFVDMELEIEIEEGDEVAVEVAGI